MLTPTLEKLESELEDKLKVVKVDVDENTDLARDFGIMSIPTMLVFKDGVLAKTIVGVKPKGQLLKELEEYL